MMLLCPIVAGVDWPNGVLLGCWPKAEVFVLPAAGAPNALAAPKAEVPAAGAPKADGVLELLPNAEVTPGCCCENAPKPAVGLDGWPKALGVEAAAPKADGAPNALAAGADDDCEKAPNPLEPGVFVAPNADFAGVAEAPPAPPKALV